MEQQVLKTIKKYNLIEKQDKIVLGVSGGPDSMAMLYSFIKLKKELDIELIVAHINHKIRKEADLEQEYVKSFCIKYNIPFYSEEVEIKAISKSEKISEEEAGRNERYKFFNQVLTRENANKIAIAHNKNDNVETMFLNMFRGTGISGLKGISISRDNIIRPLLEIEREAIEEYCKDNRLHPMIDKTNLENNYGRNKIRNIIIPYIKKEFNSNIITTLTRLSEVVKDEEEYILGQTKNSFEKIVRKQGKNVIELDLNSFNIEHIVIKSRLILYTIKKIIGSTIGIEKVNVQDIIKMCAKAEGNKYLNPTKDLKVSIANKTIYFEKI